MQRISDMTIDELREFILQVLHEQQQQSISNESARSLEDILTSIDHHMWTPPAGAKSVVELVREDRNR
jgi:hypothetical protein